MLAHVGTYWRTLAFSVLHLSFIGTYVQLFYLVLAIGLALGKSWLLLAKPQKNTDVQCLPLPIFVGRLSRANLQESPSSKTRMQSGKGFEFVCLCTADKFYVATCWHVELSTLSLLHISFNTHLSNRFSCSIQFFLSKITLGLALLESWGVACASTESPVSTFAYFCGKAFQGKPAKITFVEFMGQHWCFLLSAAAHHLTNILDYFGVDVRIYQTGGTWQGTGFSSWNVLGKKDVSKFSKHAVRRRLWICLSLHSWQILCCHLLARWTQHAQHSPPFIQHSFEQ